MLALFYLEEEILSHFYPTYVVSYASIIETSSEVRLMSSYTLHGEKIKAGPRLTLPEIAE